MKPHSFFRPLICLLLAGLLCGHVIPSYAKKSAKPSPTPQATPALSELLGDDLYAFRIALGDQLVCLPASFAEMEAAGWIFQGDAALPMTPLTTNSANYLARDGATLYVTFENASMDTLALEKTAMVGLSVASYMAKRLPVALPGGIVLGECLPEEVEAAYGPPTHTIEGDGILVYRYQRSQRQFVLLRFDENREYLLSSIEIHNAPVHDLTPSETSLASMEEAVVKQNDSYQPPEALGEDPLGFTCIYGGLLYSLPAPLSVFAEDDWVLVETDAETLIPAQGSLRVDLMKDGQYLRTTLINPLDIAIYAKYGWITGIAAGRDLAISLRLPRDIELGLSRNALLEAYADVPLASESATDTHDIYTYGQDTANCIRIYLDKKKETISRIELTNGF